jgi:hypothetical protein
LPSTSAARVRPPTSARRRIPLSASLPRALTNAV